MSGHSGYSRESKNLDNLFDLFSRNSVGLKKEKQNSSSSGIWMDMYGISRKLGSQCHYSFSSGNSDTFAAFGYENLDWCNMLPRNLSHSSEHTVRLIEANRKMFCVLRVCNLNGKSDSIQIESGRGEFKVSSNQFFCNLKTDTGKPVLWEWQKWK